MFDQHVITARNNKTGNVLRRVSVCVSVCSCGSCAVGELLNINNKKLNTNLTLLSRKITKKEFIRKQQAEYPPQKPQTSDSSAI